MRSWVVQCISFLRAIKWNWIEKTRLVISRYRHLRARRHASYSANIFDVERLQLSWTHILFQDNQFRGRSANKDPPTRNKQPCFYQWYAFRVSIARVDMPTLAGCFHREQQESFFAYCTQMFASCVKVGYARRHAGYAIWGKPLNSVFFRIFVSSDIDYQNRFMFP